MGYVLTSYGHEGFHRFSNSSQYVHDRMRTNGDIFQRYQVKHPENIQEELSEAIKDNDIIRSAGSRMTTMEFRGPTLQVQPSGDLPKIT